MGARFSNLRPLAGDESSRASALLATEHAVESAVFRVKAKAERYEADGLHLHLAHGSRSALRVGHEQTMWMLPRGGPATCAQRSRCPSAGRHRPGQPDTRIMIPLHFGATAAFEWAGGRKGATARRSRPCAPSNKCLTRIAIASCPLGERSHLVSSGSCPKRCDVPAHRANEERCGAHRGRCHLSEAGQTSSRLRL